MDLAEGRKMEMYGRMPLFPPNCAGQSSLRMPLFDTCRPACGNPSCDSCQTVRICNPACPGEYADVELCVDGDGNLSICVHRPPRPCPPPRRKKNCGCAPWLR